MAVKPLNQQQENKKVEEIINKGAKVVEESKEKKEKWAMISVRLPQFLLETMDKNRKERIGISRNAWILEAMQEKIQRNG